MERNEIINELLKGIRSMERIIENLKYNNKSIESVSEEVRDMWYNLDVYLDEE
jgi:hypothetical protein